MIFYTTLIFSLISSSAFASPYGLLDWPVKLDKAPYQFGASNAQFVEIVTKYFHLGQDILADAGDEVITPVSGTVEAGYYTYKDFSNGHSEKTFYPLGSESNYPGDIKDLRTFFEVAVIADDGLRYEFHHIDAETLPLSIKAAALRRKRVQAGSIIGKVVSRGLEQFGTLYDHIHYNVIDLDGTYINPFYVSKPIKDDIKPEIKTAYYKKLKNKVFCKLQTGVFLNEVKKDTSLKDVDYIVFEALDKISDNKIPQALTKIHVKYFSLNTGLSRKYNHPDLIYDFSYRLELSTHISDLYQGKFCIGDPAYPINLKGSVNNKFYYKVPVPKDFRGRLEVRVFDFGGNWDVKTFKINQDL